MRGIPITFVLVVMVTLLVTIFFGAWAVSADRAAGGADIAYGLPGAGPSISAGDSGRSSGADGSLDGEDSGSADSWWGSALLKACPFH